MPVFNAERFLAAALGSVLSQSFNDFECLVIDDGSDDATPSILAAHAKCDNRVRIVRQSNGGIVSALNHGLSACRAPLIARMDADDLCISTRLERQVAFMRSNPDVAVVGTAFQLMSETGKLGLAIRHPEASKDIKIGLRSGNCLGHPTVMMRREAILSAGGYRELLRHAEDYDLWTRVCERHEIANIPEILLYYRIHGRQISWSEAESQALATLAVQGLFRSRLLGVEPVPLPADLDREFLEKLGYSDQVIESLIIDLLMGRLGLCRSLGMIEDANTLYNALRERSRLNKSPKTMRSLNRKLCIYDLSSAISGRRWWPATLAIFSIMGMLSLISGLHRLFSLKLMRRP